MMGAETGARAGVGTLTGEESEAETGIWAEVVAAAVAVQETWGTGLTEAGTCIWTGGEGKTGAGLRD